MNLIKIDEWVKVLFALVLGVGLVLAVGCTSVGYEREIERPLQLPSGEVIIVKERVKGHYDYVFQNKSASADINSDGNVDLELNTSSDPVVEALKAGINLGREFK